MELMLSQLSPAEGHGIAGELRPIYLDAYSDPPYGYSESDADEFVERLQKQSARQDFRLILGRVDNEIAGFSYGFIFPRDLWWSGARDEPPRNVATGSKYAVIELVVSRSFRGNGFSRTLMDALLKDRSEDFAILLAKPGAQAHAMYQRWGWERIGEVQSYPHWPVDDAMILPLR